MLSIRKDVALLSFLSIALSFGTAACATSRDVTAREMLGGTTAQGDGSPLRAGSARVIGTHINPLAAVQAASDGGQVEVRFSHPRLRGARVNLDSGSLEPVSPEEQVPAAPTTAALEGVARLSLPGGRFIVCWNRGDAESGYRLMAQLWTATGARLGEPVAVSPDAEVIGTPRLVAVDGERILAIFAEGANDGFNLLAVPLDAPSSRDLSASWEK